MENKELLEAIRGIIKEEISGVKKEMENLTNRIDGIEVKFDNRFNALDKQTELISIKVDEVNKSIAELKGETKTLEAVTKENLYDIAKLKSIKS